MLLVKGQGLTNFPFAAVSLQGGVTMINQETNIELSFTRTQPLVKTDYILLTVPDPTYFTDTSPQCNLSTGGFTLSSCEVLPGNKQVKMVIDTQSTFVICLLNISNFKNPPSTAPLNGFIIEIYDAADVKKETSGNLELKGFTPDVLSDAKIEPQNQEVGKKNQQLKVTLTPKNQVPSDGKITIKFPYWFKNPSDLQHYINQSELQCLPEQGLRNDMKCEYNTQTQTLTLTDILSGPTTSELIFVIEGVHNPINTSVNTGFIVSTGDSSNEGLIDQSLVTVQVTQPASITQAQIQPIGSSVVGEPTVMNFILQNPVPLEPDCLIQIEFPIEVPIDQVELVSIQGSGFVKIEPQNSFKFIDPTNRVIRIDACQTYVDQGNIGFAAVNSVRNPGMKKDTGSFKISILNVDEDIVAEISNNVIIPEISLQPGDINAVEGSATQTSEVQQTSPYLIKFQPSHKLPSSSKILIQFPTTVTLNSQCSPTNFGSNGLSSSMSCTLDGPNNTYVITQPFGTNDYLPAPDLVLQLQVAEGTNPIASGDAGNVRINTYYIINGVDYAVDQFDLSGVLIFTPGTLKPTFKVDPSTTLAYEQPVQYSFQFTTKNDIPQNGKVIVDLPHTADMAISAVNIAQNECINDNGLQTNQLQCSFVVQQGQASNEPTRIIIQDGAQNQQINGNTNIELNINGLRNPRSLSTTDSVQIFTTDINQNVIDQKLTDLTITMLTVMDHDQVRIIPESLICGEVASYTIEVTVKTPLRNGDIFNVELPTPLEIFLPNQTQLDCQPIQALSNVVCEKEGGYKLMATLTFNGGSIPSSDVFSFLVQNVKNPSSTKKTQSLSAYTTDSQQGLINSYNEAIIIQMNTPALIQDAVLQQGSNEAGAKTNYRFTFTPISDIPAGGAIQIDYPVAIVIHDSGENALEVQGVSGIDTNTFDYTLDPIIRRIIITGAFTDTFAKGVQISFSMNNIYNPDSANEDSIVLTTLVDATNGYRIDYAPTGLVPSLECDFPCRTCPEDNKSFCTSCFSTSIMNKLDTILNTCVQECPEGYVSEGGSICVKCNSNCLTCAESDRNICTSCDVDGSVPKFFEGVCYKTCPNISYPTGDTCTRCHERCSSCNGPGETSCTACNQASTNPLKNYYLGECIAQCPTGTTSIGGFCRTCTSPCATCSGQTTRCTSCNGLNVLYSNQCLSSCPEATIEDAGVCTDCDPKCKSCAGSPSSCTECVGELFMYEGDCINTCPEGFDSNEDNGKCEAVILIQTPIKDFTLVPFPFLIMALITVLIAFGGKCKDSKSLIISNIIVLWSFIEFLYYPSLAIFGLMVNIQIALLGFAAFAFLIMMNIGFFIYYRKRIRRDEYFQEWCQHEFKKTSKIISILALIFSFKIQRLFYSRFFGLEHFTGRFLKFGTFQWPMIVTTIVNIIFCSLLMIIVSIIILIGDEWGTQVYICAIESIILSIVMIILEIIEFKTAKVYDEDSQLYRKIDPDVTMGQALLVNSSVNDELEREMRVRALKGLLGKLKQDGFGKPPEDVLRQRRASAAGRIDCLHMFEKEEDPRKISSYPLTPRSSGQKEIPLDTDPGDRYPDNVYAQSKAPNPIKQRSKKWTTTQTQTGMDVIERKGPDMYKSTDDGESRRTGTRKGGRGKRNKYYDEIEKEDQEEMGVEIEEEDLHVILEEEEKNKKTKKGRKSIESDYDDTEIDDPMLQRGCRIPPDDTFNENDILGDFDRDEKGHIILLTNPRGKLIDKNGRHVNVKGYLIDRHGNVIEKLTRKKMFMKETLNEKGELPGRFSLHKHGFNPFLCQGDFDKNENGEPILKQADKKGFFLDKQGRTVNSNGWLIDQDHNITDLYGRKRFDRSQLTAQQGDIPRLFNYDAKRFDIRDLMGDLTQRQVEASREGFGDEVNKDRQGRDVNKHGYLVNKSGDVIDNKGNIIFQKNQLVADGEIPKIFVFSKFNIETIQPSSEQSSTDQVTNSKGYLCDENGNVINYKDKVMFHKHELDYNRDIPRLFRTGLIRSDSATSIGRINEDDGAPTSDDENLIQTELDKLRTGRSGGQTSEEEAMGITPALYESLNKRVTLGDGDNLGEMKDFRPESQEPILEKENLEYTIQDMDQSLIQAPQSEDSYGDEEFDDFGDIQPGGVRSSQTRQQARRKKKKGKGHQKIYQDPNEHEILMARAYGGVPKGKYVTKVVKNRTSTSTLRIKGTDKERLSNLYSKRNSEIQSQASTVRSQHRRDDSIRRLRTEDGRHTSNPAQRTQRGNFLNEQLQIEGNSEVTDITPVEKPVGPFGENSVPIQEHHVREERLKRREFQQVRKRNQRSNRSNLRAESQDIDRIARQDVSDFLDNSEVDLESMMSGMSRQTSRTGFPDGRLRGLESIYLQRQGEKVKKKNKKMQPKHRVCQDRIIDDPMILAQELEGRDELTTIIADARQKKFGGRSPSKAEFSRDQNNLFPGHLKQYTNGKESSPGIDLAKKWIDEQ